ncbi:hypothetical protein, partial [Priestia megaterium]|uniref:hypothetical protein n=1 Tax=Priestia megaterium TaxID=1404 RepID=UPI001C9A0C93
TFPPKNHQPPSTHPNSISPNPPSPPQHTSLKSLPNFIKHLPTSFNSFQTLPKSSIFSPPSNKLPPS